jgi:methionyl-tRNA formyltransferase
MPLKLVFMGTPAFAVPTLEALIAAGHDVAAVYTQPPRPAGRGHRERRSAVHDVAADRAMEVRTPRTLRDADAQAAFAALDADAAVVVAYGLILPRTVLDAPRSGCFNVHASLLPRWRGAAPIQRALLAGDRETGISIMRMDDGLDTGATVSRRAIPIGAGDTAGTLHDSLAELGAQMMVETLAALEAGTLTETSQPAEGVTYAAKIDPAEAAIGWSRPATEVDLRVRAMAPHPGAYFLYRGERIKVLLSEVVTGAPAPSATEVPPGTVVADGPVIACGRGAVRLLILQRAGRKALPAAEFLRGTALPEGTLLEDGSG